MAVVTFDSLLSEIDVQESPVPVEGSVTFDSLLTGIPSREPTPPVGFNPDSFGSILSRTLNESYIGGLNFLGVIGRQIGSQDLVDLSESQIKETKKDIKALGTPTRDGSFLKGLEDIDKIYEEEGTGAALDRAALLLQDSMAYILGSVTLPFAAGATAIPLSLVGA